MKKTILLTIFTIASFCTLQAQSLGPTVIANSGASITGASNSLDFTFGEAVIGNILVPATTSLGQGFWWAAAPAITLNNDDFSLEANTVVYPNPVSNYLNITFKDMEGQDFEIAVFDIQGRIVLQQKIENTITTETLSLDALSSGNYILKVVQLETSLSKTFKIIKQ